MRAYFVLLVSIACASGQLVVPGLRGDDGTAHIEWDRFTKGSFEPNAPDVAADPDASITSSTGSAFITSGGNLYSFQSPIALQLDDTTDLEVRSLFLQISTLGSGMDLENVRLIFEDGEQGTVALPPTRSFVAAEEELTGEFGGAGTLYGIQWDLRESPLTGSYTILFGAASTSLSIDRVSLDLSEKYEIALKPLPLTVRVKEGQVIVTWFGNRQLQASQTLGDDWVDVPASEGLNEVRLPVTNGMMFFRLK